MAPGWLFVYGTLRSDAGHPVHRVLAQSARAAGRARFAGILLDLGPYPAAVPDPAEQQWVIGELYEVRDPEPLLRRLDQYEGCDRGNGEPAQYRRERREVIAEDGVVRSAWIYLYARPVGDLPRIESGDYLSRGGKGLA